MIAALALIGDHRRSLEMAINSPRFRLTA